MAPKSQAAIYSPKYTAGPVNSITYALFFWGNFGLLFFFFFFGNLHLGKGGYCVCVVTNVSLLRK